MELWRLSWTLRHGQFRVRGFSDQRQASMVLVEHLLLDGFSGKKSLLLGFCSKSSSYEKLTTTYVPRGLHVQEGLPSSIEYGGLFDPIRHDKHD